MRRLSVVAALAILLLGCGGPSGGDLDPVIAWVAPITDLECESAHFIAPTGEWLVPMWNADTREIDFFHEYEYRKAWTQ